MRDYGRVNDPCVGPGLRVARGVVAAAVAVGLGLTAHVSAGGLLPPAGWMILIVAGAATVAVASMGSPAGFVRLMVLVGGGQFATHLMLTALAGHDGDHRPVRVPLTNAQERIADVDSGRSGSLHDLMMGRVEPSTDGDFVLPHWASHIVDDVTGPHAAMAVAHLAAAAIVAWWLARGEQALWTVLTLLGASVMQALVRLIAAYDIAPLFARPSTPGTVQAQRWCLLLAPMTGGLGRRGPPLIAI